MHHRLHILLIMACAVLLVGSTADTVWGAQDDSADSTPVKDGTVTTVVEPLE